ncbi:hypothetical protein [Jannaschia seohaensis]|uniref:Uncharacterized protein n=1 Tax=Jannaschia seohaensis TaxID=475081 RepID=A0A2Y9AQT5_9RHOB|nr:hypothetical protein [Jannaschia seohaensis]PWJ19084.1 hypothetical protein BCF38_10412 [Jannaschia seohaensis]SSA45698.1 hypothetical protein SAMN05421539_10412 [Jannaschia seohaensis]
MAFIDLPRPILPTLRPLRAALPRLFERRRSPTRSAHRPAPPKIDAATALHLRTLGAAPRR